MVRGRVFLERRMLSQRECERPVTENTGIRGQGAMQASQRVSERQMFAERRFQVFLKEADVPSVAVLGSWRTHGALSEYSDGE